MKVRGQVTWKNQPRNILHKKDNTLRKEGSRQHLESKRIGESDKGRAAKREIFPMEHEGLHSTSKRMIMKDLLPMNVSVRCSPRGHENKEPPEGKR